MITGLSICNFKNLVAIPATADALVPFGPLNVLIGPNGCGKSSLLQAIDFLRAFFRSSVEVYLQEKDWYYDDLPNLRENTKKITWRVRATLPADQHNNGAGEYEYSTTLQPRRYVGIGEERLVWTPLGDSPGSLTLLERMGRQVKYLMREEGKRVPKQSEIANLPASFLSTIDPDQEREAFPEALRFREWVERFQLFLIWDPKVLRQPSFRPHMAHRMPHLGCSGENLPAVLDSLKTTNPDGFSRLVRRIERLIPTFTGMDVLNDQGWDLLCQHEGDAIYNSQQMSDGILRLLAVTSLLYVQEPPSVVMFEEPENGVHPQLIREMVQILRELTTRKPPNQTQVFITTHSPYVLDEFIDHPEQVYAMERSKPGAGATITRLSDRAQMTKVREVYSTSLGEAWVSGLLGATAGI